MITEKWECNLCGTPCKIQIEYTDVKLPKHLKGRLRFNSSICICEESRHPTWESKGIFKVGADNLEGKENE